ncbi:unnamed protein product [Pedinophyceae sp. YPF-701]|nr:unnamed protein product [Pedinophyceae sp. YPF-701]
MDPLLPIGLVVILGGWPERDDTPVLDMVGSLLEVYRRAFAGVIVSGDLKTQVPPQWADDALHCPLAFKNYLCFSMAMERFEARGLRVHGYALLQMDTYVNMLSVLHAPLDHVWVHGREGGPVMAGRACGDLEGLPNDSKGGDWEFWTARGPHLHPDLDLRESTEQFWVRLKELGWLPADFPTENAFILENEFYYVPRALAADFGLLADEAVDLGLMHEVAVPGILMTLMRRGARCHEMSFRGGFREQLAPELGLLEVDTGHKFNPRDDALVAQLTRLAELQMDAAREQKRAARAGLAPEELCVPGRGRGGEEAAPAVEAAERRR